MLFAPKVFKLINKGDIAALEAFLAKKPDEVNHKTKKLGLPATAAVKSGNVELVKFLLAHKGKVNGNSLYEAVMAANVELVKLCLDAKVSPRASVEKIMGPRPVFAHVFYALDPERDEARYNEWCIAAIDLFAAAGLGRDAKFQETILDYYGDMWGTFMIQPTKVMTRAVVDHLADTLFTFNVNAKSMIKAIGADSPALVSWLLARDPALANARHESDDVLDFATFGYFLKYDDERDRRQRGEIITLLLDAGANVDKKLASNTTACHSFLWRLFMETGSVDDPLLPRFLEKSADRQARFLYEELRKGRNSRAPFVCATCEKPFILKDLQNYRELLKAGRVAVTCPNCRKDALMGVVRALAFADDAAWEAMMSGSLK